MRTETVKIVDLTNPQAANTISQALERLEGVGSVNVSVQDQRVTVSFDESLASPQGLREAVAGLGFEIAKPAHGEDGSCCGGCGG